MSDLRRIGIHPDFWYPLARSHDLKRNKTVGGVVKGSTKSPSTSTGAP